MREKGDAIREVELRVPHHLRVRARVQRGRGRDDGGRCARPAAAHQWQTRGADFRGVQEELAHCQADGPQGLFNCDVYVGQVWLFGAGPHFWGVA